MAEQMSGRERQAMVMAYTVMESMYVQEEALKDRLRKTDKAAWRDFRAAMAMQKKTLDRIRSTLTDKDRKWMARIVEHCKINVDIDGPLRRPDYLLVDNIDMANICAMAARNECSLCIRTGKEVKRCKLRECLIAVTPPPQFAPDGLCEYAMVDWEGES